MDTCSNRRYGTETKNATKHKTETLQDHGQAIFLNTDKSAYERSHSVQENDNAYEILPLSSPKQKVPAKKNPEHGQCVIGKKYRMFFVFGGLMFALFCMVTGVAVAVNGLHTSGDLHHSWEPWAPWSPCSVTCDFGISLRKRNCSNGDSNTGVNDCVGDASEYRLCNEALCNGLALNGGWSEWLSWGTCSTTCDAGLQSRQRTCSNPKPSSGGEHLFGDSSEYKLCKLRSCPVNDGYWSSWSNWSPCSYTCSKTRTRNCTIYADGRQCLGNSVDKENCYSAECGDYSHLWVRLIGSSNGGRLEVSLDGSDWGTVCNDDFDTNDARVACRMLGYTGLNSVLDADDVLDGSGPIYLDNLDCKGTESSLLYCGNSGWGASNCDYDEDVGIFCHN